MKFSKLKEIVNNHVIDLGISASYSGFCGEYGTNIILNKLKNFQDNLVIEYDLKPSEFNKLNDIEVGEPNQFKLIIEKYNIKL